VHAAARVLNNHQDESAAVVQRRFDGLIGAMVRHRGKAGTLADAIGHFRKVARSYRPGLFHCYAVPDLPRTNNDLEQWFGVQRHHDRRATGRKMASPATVLRGEVRLIAAAATRLQPPTAAALGRADRTAWGRDAPASRPKAPRSDAPHPVPPRPGHLPRYSGTASMPANFAVLVKKTLHAAEQDRPDVAAARADWKQKHPPPAFHLLCRRNLDRLRPP